MNCYFCQKNVKEVDYKDTETLKRFTSSMKKIKPRRKTGMCATHQRQLAKSIKKARQLGLLPYTPK